MALSASVPESLKAIKAYLLRAEELDKAHDDKTKLVAYHCRTYAIELGLTLNDKTPESNNCLMQIMQRLESDKASLSLTSASLDERQEIVSSFALKVWNGANKHDREGKSDKETARSFYAAANFLEVLKQFSPSKELDKETKDKVVYAKWRATEIVKAIKEGRTPDPPPSEGDEETQQQEENKDEELPPVPGSHAALERHASIIAKAQQEAASAATSTSSTSAPSASTAASNASVARSRVLSDHDDKPTSMAFGKPVKSLNKTKRMDAIEYGKYALKAVETDEIDLAIQYFKKALQLLHE